MSFLRPSDVRKSFPTAYRVPVPKPNDPRRRTNHWPGTRISYEALEKCKEVVCWAPHPTAYYQHRKTEYRISILPWSRGAYVDIRMYKNGNPSPTGILLHLDVISAILPDLMATVRRLENADEREPGQKAEVKVMYP